MYCFVYKLKVVDSKLTVQYLRQKSGVTVKLV